MKGGGRASWRKVLQDEDGMVEGEGESSGGGGGG